MESVGLNCDGCPLWVPDGSLSFHPLKTMCVFFLITKPPNFRKYAYLLSAEREQQPGVFAGLLEASWTAVTRIWEVTASGQEMIWHVFPCRTTNMYIFFSRFYKLSFMEPTATHDITL